VGRPVEGAKGDRKRAPHGRVASVPDPQLVERPRRRKFTAASKLEVLRDAEGCTKPGEIGALLRRGPVNVALECMAQAARRGGA